MRACRPRRQAAAQSSRRAAARSLLALLLFACLWSAYPRAVAAGWLARLLGEHASSAPRRAAGALEDIAAHLTALTPDVRRAALAAEATEDGHWRFVNAQGELLTAGTADELARVASLLLPDLGNTALVLFIGEDAIFGHRQALSDLPKGSTLNLVLGTESYPLVRRGDGRSERMFAQVRANLLVAMDEQRSFKEAVWQLARPLAAAGVRVLALEPGAPSTLPASPRIDPVSRRALVDAVEPASLATGLGAVRGQTVLISGRIDDRQLTVQPARGGERSVLLSDLSRAAEAADVNLVVLHAKTTPRQPGGRNWLWQKVEVEGLERALEHARLADFFNALGAANSPLLVAATTQGRRTGLAITPVDGASSSSPIDIGGVFSGILSQITGRVAIAGVSASLRSAEREQELSWRIVPGLPADLQVGYLLLIVLGLFGVRQARASFGRLWPPEASADYAGRSGYFAAVTMRGAAFLVLFLPLFACCAPLLLARRVFEALAGALRLRRGAGRVHAFARAHPRLAAKVERTSGGAGPQAR
jgi:hypothetical protein